MSEYVNDINNNEESIISNFIVILFGIIIGSIIGYYLFKEIKYIGPDSNAIIKEIHIDEKGKKYRYIPKITICPVNYSMNKLHDPNFKESH